MQAWNEMGQSCNESRECLACGGTLVVQAKGRPRKFCGNACRVAHHRRSRMTLPVSASEPVETKPVEPEGSGKEVLANLLEDLECLDSPDITSVLTVGRTSLDLEHTKLRQVEHTDFLDFTPITNELGGLDACFWCLGVSAGGMNEQEQDQESVAIAIEGASGLGVVGSLSLILNAW